MGDRALLSLAFGGGAPRAGAGPGGAPASMLEQGVQEQAIHLGMDPSVDAAHLWIARESLLAPLPEGWELLQTEEGHPYFYDARTGESQWEHPRDDFYRQLYRQHRSEEALLTARRCAAQAQSLPDSPIDAAQLAAQGTLALRPTHPSTMPAPAPPARKQRRTMMAWSAPGSAAPAPASRQEDDEARCGGPVRDGVLAQPGEAPRGAAAVEDGSRIASAEAELRAAKDRGWREIDALAEQLEALGRRNAELEAQLDRTLTQQREAERAAVAAHAHAQRPPREREGHAARRAGEGSRGEGLEVATSTVRTSTEQGWRGLLSSVEGALNGCFYFDPTRERAGETGSSWVANVEQLGGMVDDLLQLVDAVCARCPARSLDGGQPRTAALAGWARP